MSEIYDRIAFAGVGRYNEFDQLRIAGVRAADLKGYQYSRDDVDARSLANQYAQILGQIFTHEMKPMEVEILVAEVGTRAPATTSCSTSSTTAPSSTRSASACSAATPRPSPSGWSGWRPGLSLAGALHIAVAALAGPDRTLGADDLEVAVLAGSNGRRAFRRLDDAEGGRAAARAGCERPTAARTRARRTSSADQAERPDAPRQRRSGATAERGGHGASRARPIAGRAARAIHVEPPAPSAASGRASASARRPGPARTGRARRRRPSAPRGSPRPRAGRRRPWRRTASSAVMSRTMRMGWSCVDRFTPRRVVAGRWPSDRRDPGVR